MLTGVLPRLVVVEGVDGVGKSTLARRIAQKFGYEYRYPVPKPFSEIRQQIEGLGDVDARFFYYLAGNVALQSKLRAELVAGTRVVFDRYVFSTFASHAAMGASLGGLTVAHVPFMQPDLAILLTCDSAVRNARIIARARESEGQQYVTEFGHILDETERRLLGFQIFHRIDTTTMTEEEVFTAAERLLWHELAVA
jgi:dTMP kinase